MIRALNDENRAQFAAVCRGVPGLGAEVLANSEAFAGHPALMRFFVCGEGGALMLRGRGGVLLGQADEEELAGMLAFAGVDSLKTSGCVPFGWAKKEKLAVMRLARPAAVPPLPEGVRLVKDAPMSRVLRVLECVGLAGEAADNFYSEACTKRSRGLAEIWLAEQNGRPVATAGAYAVLENEACLAAVATLPEERGRGIGRALCGALCARLAAGGRDVTLLCREERRGFYCLQGFETCGEAWDLRQ